MLYSVTLQFSVSVSAKWIVVDMGSLSETNSAISIPLVSELLSAAVLFKSTVFYFIDAWIMLNMDNDYGKHDGLSICIYEGLQVLDLHCNEMDFLAYPMDIQVSRYI